MKKDKTTIKTKITAGPQQEGLRLDVFLSSHLSSRSQAEKYLKQAFVKNKQGKIINKPSYKIKTGDSFTLHYPVIKKSIQKIPPYNIPISILFEDSHIIVINKPAGLVVHPACGHEQDTLINALVSKTTLQGGSSVLRQGIVHRLDKDVSGLMILSKTQAAYDQLLQQFKSRTVKRIYHCIIYAKHTLLKKEQKIESFIGRHPQNRKKFHSFNHHLTKEIPPHAKKAVTYYHVIQSYGNRFHHLKCRLLTGRTHQIRVHLANRSLWIIGDPIYFPKKQFNNINQTLQKKIQSLNRIALYAAHLSFIHPIHKHQLEFYLPWPEDLRSFLLNLPLTK